MKTIAIVNQKGGTGKTQTAISLAIGLARQGEKVLLCDTDPQGSATVSLGFTEQDKLPITLSTLLEKVINDEEIGENEGILHHEENIDLVPANIELSGLEVTLVNTMSRETILKEYLKTVENQYSYCVLDCSPSLGMVTINALACSDEIIIPVQPQYLSVKGMEQLFKTISKVRKQINPKLSIGGILITMADMRTNYTKDIISLLQNTYQGRLNIYESIIPLSVRAAETSAEGKSIFTYAPNCKVANAYENLVGEVMSV